MAKPDLEPEISLWPQRNLSVATQKSLCGHTEIPLWLQRDLSVATKRSLCGHREIPLWLQRDFSVAAERSLCGHREISLWPQSDLSVATERSLCDQGCSRRTGGVRWGAEAPPTHRPTAPTPPKNAGGGPCGHSEISLWPQRDPSAATETSLCGYREITLWP